MVDINESDSGTIHVALDETFDPVVGVCAVAVQQHFLSLNNEISQLYFDLSQDYYMRDLESFEKFVKDGFHKTADPKEVSARFINFLSKTVGFKTFILFSERTARPDLSDLKLVLMLYGEVVRTILGRNRRRSSVVFHFEQHEQLNCYLEPLVLSIRSKLRGRKPNVSVELGTKMNPPMLAVADYALHTFGTWWRQTKDQSPVLKAVEQYQWRDMMAISRSISLIRSLERGTIARRDLPDLIGGML